MLKAEGLKLAQISIRGVVQGVGFRPTVFRLAEKYGLRGWVRNTSGDVKIEVEGMSDELSRFLTDLQRQAPPCSHIDGMNLDFSPPKGYRRFEIRDSDAEVGQYQLISPDIAICQLCQEELSHPTDRRYRYPFTNCTNCGPRFTIIQDIPYDRPKTTMRRFRMCPQCQREYEDPFDRRFHAQPNACPSCGPKLELVDRTGQPICSRDPIADAGGLLKKGKILGLKGLGGFLLVCDATKEQVVQGLRQRKSRAFKPLAVMMATIEEIRLHCHVSREEEALLTSPISPIVLLRRKDKELICPGVAPKLDYLGVMLPYTPLHHLLLREAGMPLVMTSGNISGEPIVKDNDEAVRKLGCVADYFLLHNRDIYVRCDDSVTIVENGRPQVIRRARGYAPNPIRLSFTAREVLACGGDLKSSFCMTKEEYAFISQHMGDMENLEILRHFDNTIDLYKRLFRVEPKIVAHDRHPDYFSTRYAYDLKAGNNGLILVPVQHHHAHIVSCMAENHLNSPVLGVSFDGTGYGDDGHIWGGEFLLVDYGQYRRLGHLQYVPMPGGSTAILRPCRMAISYIFTLLGKKALNEAWPSLEWAGSVEIDLVKKQIEKRINSPMTSSAGRLFDGVAALIGLRDKVEYEAQAAIDLEMVAQEEPERDETYPFEIAYQNGVKVVLLRGLFRGILADLAQGLTQPEISAKFHRTVACMIVLMCRYMAQTTGIKQVALSGGVFQNRFLLRITKKCLEEEGFGVYIHGEVPCNDGGIALGQAVVANIVNGITT